MLLFGQCGLCQSLKPVLVFLKIAANLGYGIRKTKAQTKTQEARKVKIVREYCSRDSLDMIELFYADNGRAATYSLDEIDIFLKEYGNLDLIRKYKQVLSKHGAFSRAPKDVIRRKP